MVLASAIALWATVQLTRTPEYPGQCYIVRDGVPSVMPLERTSVNAEVAGMGARVTVRQTFRNPSTAPIEALYTFPLPNDAAVDRMRIKVGPRIIDAKIMKRDAARQVYEAARAEGKVAALLDQETDNIFTQSVANVMPGHKVEVEISYVHPLKFVDGQFEFHFPMVVAPRFMGQGTPNPEKINPPRMPVGVRSGQNIDLTATIRGGAPIRQFQSILHPIDARRPEEDTLVVKLARRDEIPNRDFIFRYRIASDEIEDALLTHWDPDRGGTFALLLAPPARPSATQRSPKELIFVIDQSGSQQGFPIEKSKELALKLMDTMGPEDAFNVLGFSNEVDPLWPGPRPNTPANRAAAAQRIRGMQARGGTQLDLAVTAALSTPTDPRRVRLVVFNTDGLAGQESVILSNIQQHRGMARVFTFGIGNSVNRALIDAMSLEGRGAAEVVTIAEKADEAVARFAQRMDKPILVDVRASFADRWVEQVTPQNLPDVFSNSPVVVYGRYRRARRTKVTLSGLAAGEPWSRTVELNLPTGSGDGSSIGSLWARQRIAELKSETYVSAAFGKAHDSKEQITQIALDFGLMSEYTSFVAVDSAVANKTGRLDLVNTRVEAADKVGAQGLSLGMQRTAAGAGGAATGGVGGGGLSANFSASPAPGLPGGGGRIPRDTTGTTLVDRDAWLTQALTSAGPHEIRLTVTKVTSELLKRLKEAGFTVESHDGATQVFGSASGDSIKKLIAMAEVTMVRPL